MLTAYKHRLVLNYLNSTELATVQTKLDEVSFDSKGIIHFKQLSLNTLLYHNV